MLLTSSATIVFMVRVYLLLFTFNKYTFNRLQQVSVIIDTTDQDKDDPVDPPFLQLSVSV